QILETAAEFMQTRAFSAFSYQDIADRLGITKAAIHSHYRTKELLGNALLEKSLEDLKEFHRKVENSSDDVWERFDAFVTASESLVIDENKVCPVGVLQVEHNVIQESIQKAVSRFYNQNRAWIVKLLEQGREGGEMIFQGNTEDQAELVLAAIQGALMNARAERLEILSNVAKQLKASMKSVQ
ncbi:MAG: TetR/AcrR family transcriptional regulator, partial [Desulfobulbia bacterium]